MSNIAIPEPCTENFSAMSKCEKGLYCSLCEKHVLDLRKKDLKTVQTVLEKNPGACVVMDSRHVTGKKAWAWTERMAAFLRGYRFTRTAAVLMACCMLLASCRRRYIGGAYAMKNTAGPQEKTEKI